MTGVIKVNQLEGRSTAGSLAVTGEGNSTTTNLQQGLAKVYFNIDQTSGATITGSFNIGSATDNSTGDFTVNFTNNLNSADDAAAPLGARNAFLQIHDTYITTSSLELYSRNVTPAVTDQTLNTGAVFGSLA